MSTRRSLVDLVVERLGEEASARAMFGEYGVYYAGTLIALMCDDRLFLKPSDAGRALLPDAEMAPPYPGAKPSMVVPEETWEDASLMRALAKATQAAYASAAARKPKAKAVGRKRG